MNKIKEKKLIKKINLTTEGFKGYNHRSHRTNNVNIDFTSKGKKKTIVEKIIRKEKRKLDNKINILKKSL
jgi:Flp pilus assembly CpaF family ATPase